MINKNIHSYLSRYLISEYEIRSPFLSNGELEGQFIKVNELANKQDIIIKLMMRQKNTNDKFGVTRLWTEFQNTFWRIVIGDPYSKYQKHLEQETLEANRRFVKFCIKLIEDNRNDHDKLPGRIFIDVTNTSRSSNVSGIQRVVFEISRKLITSNVCPVIFNKSGLVTYNAATQNLEPVKFEKNDTLIMADLGLDYQESIAEAMSRNHAVGGVNIVFLYDLIPLNIPLTCGVALSYKFFWWLKNCAFKSDLILCNTQAVAEQVEAISSEFISNMHNAPKIGFFPLGSEISIKKDSNPSEQVLRLIHNQSKIFLSVGTIEPRKGYSISLDAIEKCWHQNEEFIFVIAGRYGWGQNNLRKRILEHPEYGKRLIWLTDASDSDLSILYESSRALIFSSIEEGFGLPLIEAFQYGLPVIASDIPVFQEICGENAEYFEVANVQKLSEKISNLCKEPKKNISFYSISWDNSASIIIDNICDLIQSKSKMA
jgi:glycosyltransferase involved in cell wall biosynthesis